MAIAVFLKFFNLLVPNYFSIGSPAAGCYNRDSDNSLCDFASAAAIAKITNTTNKKSVRLKAQTILSALA
ncbi:hypothetical protein [Massilia sp. Root418]|uniref:hypothetical protein n=1 Tax=Massilia sp. Root418 TaxID=1736532 RepID=UPI00138F138B|nr:hypothetical protein [Massilia sp. Root418]